jgi:hypothetical protein
MSSEQLADGVNPLDAELAATWDVLKGYSGRDTDLGIARRFGGATAAYSLRDIGAMNGKVVRVRRDVDGQGSDPEEDFSANQVSSGALENWVNGKLETTAIGDIATARSLHSLRKIKSGYNGNALRIRRIDNTEVDVAFDSDNKVSTSSSITNITSGDVDDTAETTLGNFLQGEANVRALFNSSAYFPTDSDYFSLGSGLTLSGAFTISYDVVFTGSFTTIVFTGSFTTNTSRIFQDDAGNDLLTFTASDVCKFRVGTIVRTMPALSTALQLGRKYSMIFARDGSGVYTLTVDGVVLSTTSATDTDDFLIQRIGFRNRGSISNININSGQHIYAGDGAENSNWLDTGSGTTTNATKVGTPVAFTGQGMDSFVHTWYNQSGASTGATQTTAQRQPKIATNGTLLDHILFEGSGTVTTPAATDQYLVDTSIDFANALTLGCVSDRLTTTSNGMYPVSVSRQSATNRFFGIQEATSQSVFITRNSTSVSHFADNTSELKRFTIGRVGSGSETDAEISIFGRAFGNNNGADWGNTVSISNQNSFVIGALGLANDTGSVATNTATFQGKVYETFAYQTDEKDELFKIASNVNNYYGLYNDANETNGDFDKTFSPTADGTFTPNGKDGFTLAVVSSTVYAGIKLNADVTSGDSIYVSFNCSFDAGSPSPKIALRNTDSDFFGGGVQMSNEESVVNGFNSFTLTSNNSLASGVVLSEADDNLTYSISDFKVSRIARNGFVETWYDQSGSGNNATQTTASNQPAIVQNGGLIADGIKFDGSADALNFTDLTLTDASIFTVLDIDGTENLQIILGGSTTTATATMIPMMQTSSTTTQVYKNATVGGAEQGNSQFRNGSQITLNNRGDAYTELAAQDKMLFTMIDVDVAADKVLDGISQTPSDATTWALKGTMEELIIYNSDLSSDRGTIESEIANHYNITLS